MVICAKRGVKIHLCIIFFLNDLIKITDYGYHFILWMCFVNMYYKNSWSKKLCDPSFL